MQRIRCVRLIEALNLLLLCLVIVPPCAAFVPYGPRFSPSRALLQQEKKAIIHTIDFKELETHDLGTGPDLALKEKALRGALEVRGPETQEVQYGAYDVTAPMVAELTTMVVEQMVRLWHVYIGCVDGSCLRHDRRMLRIS